MNIELTEKEIEQVLNAIIFNEQEDIDVYNKIYDQLCEQREAGQSGEPSSKEVTENLQELIELAMQHDLTVQIETKDGEDMPQFVTAKAGKSNKQIAIGILRIKVGMGCLISSVTAEKSCLFTSKFASHPREIMNVALKAAAAELRRNI